MGGVLKARRWWFVAIAVAVVLAIGATVTVFELVASGRDSLSHRAGLLRPGMTKLEMIETMGCAPFDVSRTYPPEGGAPNGTVLFWGDYRRYVITTVMDLDDKFIGDPIIEDHPPARRGALGWIKELLGW
jgi:hypothetical protein